MFWNQMRKSALYFLDIPFEERLKYIVNSYGAFNKNELVESIMKIQKRLGGLETKNAINYLLENKVAHFTFQQIINGIFCFKAPLIFFEFS